MKVTSVFSLFFLFLLSSKSIGQTKYQSDFSEFLTIINENYAYLDQQKIEWEKLRDIYEPQAAHISTDAEFIAFLETVLRELHNGHSSLNVNLAGSNRLVPSGLDLRVEKQNSKYIITDLRQGFSAERAGLKVGMELTKVNGTPIEPQLQNFLPKFTNDPTPEMSQFAIDMLFAGTHDRHLEVTAFENGTPKKFRLQTSPPDLALLSVKILGKNTALIKINNSLGNNSLIPAFDSAVDSLLNYKKLFIDLTETPGGGNTTVARAIMGRFVKKTLPYQIHEFDEKQFGTKRRWAEYVTPRKQQFKGKVYLLVGYWTGSMGEGIAIGMDNMNAADVVGTKMAGLLGAVSNFQLTQTNIGFQIPTQRLYHFNGTARENFIPAPKTKNIKKILSASQR